MLWNLPEDCNQTWSIVLATYVHTFLIVFASSQMYSLFGIHMLFSICPWKLRILKEYYLNDFVLCMFALRKQPSIPISLFNQNTHDIIFCVSINFNLKRLQV